jgi:hypothetical protein
MSAALPSREFRLSPLGSQHGVSCDEHGAFVSCVPLLTHAPGKDGRREWRPRGAQELSADLSKKPGLPIDASSKSRGIAALAKALNDADIVRAQLIVLHLLFPNSQPRPSSRSFSREKFVGFIKALAASGLIKADWDPDEHPRWPAGAADSQGGQFTRTDEAAESGVTDASNADSKRSEVSSTADVNPAGARPREDIDLSAPSSAVADDSNGDLPEPVVYRGDYHDEVVQDLARALRSKGLKVETELPMEMADGSGGTRIDILVKAKIVFGIEVKTGDNPFPTNSQLYVYPHMMMGGSVMATNPRIATVGLPPLVPLPPIPIYLYYQKDATSEPISEPFDPKKMLEELGRRVARRKVRKFEPFFD